MCGLSLEKLTISGTPPHDAMRKFRDWIIWTVGNKRAVFVGFNLGFDWSFVNYYFIRYLGSNPFGISGLDSKSLWLGKTSCKWAETSKTHIKRQLGLRLEHSHHALEDAREQAIVFSKILSYNLSTS